MVEQLTLTAYSLIVSGGWLCLGESEAIKEEEKMRSILRLATMVFAAVTCCCVGQTRNVEGETTGRFYNQVWTTWSSEPLSVYVCDQGNVYIRGGDGILKCVGYIGPKDLKTLVFLLTKSQQWVETARDKKLEITKPLGKFLTGGRLNRQGIELTFFAGNQGAQTDVILKIHDFESTISNIELYLNEKQVAEFIEILRRVPDTYRELLRQKKAAEALK